MPDGLRRLGAAVLAYLLGFLALAVFAALAFGHGTPTPERLINAFKWCSGLAAVELALLARRPAPVNRLIAGANLWLILGGLAAFTQQWWFLRLYERLGEASLFATMLMVGAAATVATPSGFVGARGPRRKVLLASAVLLAGVVAALCVAVAWRGNTQFAAVLPVIGLSWLYRGLTHWAQDSLE